MRSRSLRILLIGIFSLWFGIIVPGHERGAIRVAGADANEAGDGSCHTVKKSACDHCPTQSVPSGDQPAKAPSDPSQHCAICKFIGVLDAPTIITFDLPAVYLLSVLDPPTFECVRGVDHFFISCSRGPPLLA